MNTHSALPSRDRRAAYIRKCTVVSAFALSLAAAVTIASAQDFSDAEEAAQRRPRGPDTSPMLGENSTAPGFPESGPWVSFYGGAALDEDEDPAVTEARLARVANAFRIINIDADPDTDNFTDAQLRTLQAGGQNKVLSYLNLGSCEKFRSYYARRPPGHASCQSSGALTTPYDGYDDEMWANLSDPEYQDLIVNYVAPRLAERGIDGFYLDNLEVVEHGPNEGNGPCDAACSAGGLELVWKLRQRFPDLLIVMQNATSDVTRLGETHGVPFRSLLSGVAHEEVWSFGGDSNALREMQAWSAMNLGASGRRFWLAVEEYVGECSEANVEEAGEIYAAAAALGFSAYVTDQSGGQEAPCFW